MSAEPAPDRPHLRVVDDAGELHDVPAEKSEALRLVAELERQVQLLENDLQGKRLAIDRLKADREQQALASPETPKVELVHVVWRKAFGKRRPLHYADRENIAGAVKKLGLALCLRALAGAHFDPYTRRLRNGKLKRFDDLNTVFKNYGAVAEHAERAPEGWAPDPERVAELAGVEVERVRDWLRA
jgi:hypothetical protein